MSYNIIEDSNFGNIIFNPLENDNQTIAEYFSPVIDESFGSNPFIESSPDERIIINFEEQNNNKYFPFTKGEGLINTLEKIGLKANLISSENNNEYSYNQDKISFKFKTIEYNKDKKGNLKKKKKERRMKPDHIIARIKSKIHNEIKDIINKKLFKAGAKELFESFPQCFITNVSINFNNNILNLTYEDLINSDKAILDSKEYKEKRDKNESDNKKYKKNKDVLEKLNKNEEISIKSEFDKIKKMNYIDILKAYFSSMEFENSIKDLYNKKEKLTYIENYINKALNYVNYFSYHKKIMNIKEENEA